MRTLSFAAIAVVAVAAIAGAGAASAQETPRKGGQESAATFPIALHPYSWCDG